MNIRSGSKEIPSQGFGCNFSDSELDTVYQVLRWATHGINTKSVLADYIKAQVSYRCKLVQRCSRTMPESWSV